MCCVLVPTLQNTDSGRSCVPPVCSDSNSSKYRLRSFLCCPCVFWFQLFNIQIPVIPVFLSSPVCCGSNFSIYRFRSFLCFCVPLCVLVPTFQYTDSARSFSVQKLETVTSYSARHPETGVEGRRGFVGDFYHVSDTLAGNASVTAINVRYQLIYHHRHHHHCHHHHRRRQDHHHPNLLLLLLLLFL